MKKTVNFEILSETQEGRRTFFAVRAMVDGQELQGYVRCTNGKVWFVGLDKIFYSVAVSLPPRTFFDLLVRALEEGWNEDRLIHEAILAKAAAAAKAEAEEVHA